MKLHDANMRNPKWVRDEVILALELYFRVNPSHASQNHSEIVRLSELLNSLPLHPKSNRAEKFRNPNGVYMKLCNFLSLDPDYQGEGLAAHSKMDEEVWREFSNDRNRLVKTAQAIRSSYKSLDPPQTSRGQSELLDEDEEFPEGRILTRRHKQRERSSALVRKKKKQILKKTGKLGCEVCNFDFAEFYGEVGYGFAECHHNKPVAEIAEGEKTKLSDLSIVCANCHRILHKSRPWFTVQELRQTLTSQSRPQRVA